MKINLLATPAWRREVAPIAAPPPAEIPALKTVFIIEDDSESQRVMRLALAGEACRIETAASAEAAMRRLSASPPALILLNPQVLADDGTPLARKLLADPRLVSIPIVALAETGPGAARTPEPGGPFDGRIASPVNPETFPAEVRALLDSTSQPPAAQPAGLSFPDTGDRLVQVGNLLDAIEAGLPDSQFSADTRPSLARLAEAAGDLGNPEVAGYLQRAERLSGAATARGRSRFQSVIHHCRELLDSEPDATPGLGELRAGYVDRRRAELGNLESSLKSGDFAALGKAGHNLKGTGAAYGFGELTAIGRAIEAAARQFDAAAIEELLGRIESYLDMVHPAAV